MNPSPTDGAVVSRVAVSLLLPAALFVCAQLVPSPPAPLHVYPSARSACPSPTLATDSALCSPSDSEACAGCVAHLCKLGRIGQADATRLSLRFANPSDDPACALTPVVSASGGASMRHEAAALLGGNVLDPSACVRDGATTDCSFEAHPWSGWHVALLREGGADTPPEIATAVHLAVLRVDGTGARPGKFAVAGLLALAAMSCFFLYARGSFATPRAPKIAMRDGAVGGGLGGLLVALTPYEAGGLGLAMPESVVAPVVFVVVGALAAGGLALTSRDKGGSLPRSVAAICLLFVASFSVGTVVAELRGLNLWPATRLHVSHIAYGLCAALAPLLFIPSDLAGRGARRAGLPWSPGLPLSVAAAGLALCALVGGAVSDLVEAASAIPDIRSLGPPLEAFVHAAGCTLAAAGVALAMGRSAPEPTAWDHTLDEGGRGLSALTLKTPLLLVEDAQRLQVGELTLQLAVDPSAPGGRRHFEVFRRGEPCHGALRAGVISTLEAALQRPEASRFANCQLDIRVDFDHAPSGDATFSGRSYQLPLALAALDLARREREAPGARVTPWMATGCLDADGDRILPVEGLAIKASGARPGGILLCPLGSDDELSAGARLKAQAGAATVLRLSAQADLRQVERELARPQRLSRGVIVQVATVDLALALLGSEWAEPLTEPRSARSNDGKRHVG